MPALEALERRWLPALTFQFADAVGVVGTGSVDVESNSVANDAAGNVYVTGSLQGTADFDPGPGVTNLTSTGGRDVVVAKYDKTGALVWAKDLRGADPTSVAQGGGVAVDAAGNVVLTGTFTGAVNFDPNVGSTTFTAAGRNDVYVAKYDSNGNLLWARDAVGSSGSIDEGYALAVDGSGNVAVAGSFQGTATFGTTTVTAGGSFESFVAKLSPAGQFLWAGATTGSGPSVAQAAGVAFDGAGNVVTTGFFAGAVNFNPGAGAPVTLPVAGSRDVFIQKLTSGGALAWAEAVGGPDIDQGNSVAADAAGNVYVTGVFSQTVNFNPGAGAPVNLTAGGYEDGFLLKLGPAGQLAWAKDLAVKNFNAAQGTGVALDASGRVFVAGYYQGTLTLDPASGGTLTSAGGFDVFVGGYDAAGNFVAGQSAGGSNFDADFGIGVNPSGLISIAGRYSGPATFGSFTLPAQPNKSIFIAQLAAPAAATPAPGPPALEAASDSGLSNSDRVTNVTAPVFDVLSGVTAPGNLVELLRDGVVVGRRNGAGAITDPGPVPDGAHVYTARQTDGLGRVSPLSTATTVTVATRAPAAPGAPLLNPADDSGVKGDGITNVKQPRFTGTIDALTLAQLLDAGGNVVATTMTGADGSFSLSPPGALADGTYAYRVREEDLAGNFSPPGPALNTTILTTPPPMPGAPALLPADDTGVKGDGITSVRQPRLIGSSTVGLTIQIVDPNGVVLGSARTAADGSYTVMIASPLADGTYFLRAQAVDVAANVGTASASFALTIRAVVNPPPTPSVPALYFGDDTGVAGDGITAVRQPHLVGTAAPGATVQIVAAGAVLGSAVAAPDGSYSVAPAAPLADGTYAVQAQAADGSGNTSAPSAPMTLTILATPPPAPAPPALLAADDSGTPGDGITNVRQPHLVGTAGGVSVQILSAAGAVLGTAPVGSGGGYSVAFASPLADGTYPVRVRAVDVAGNLGAPSTALTLTILATPPPAPSTPALLPADDTGVKGDGITTVRQPHLVGSSVAGDTVQLIDPGNTVLGSAVAVADGSYSILVASPLALGTYALRTRAVDVAGNVGPGSASFTLTIQGTSNLPPTPSVPALYFGDDTGVAGDGITAVRQPHLVGTAAPGATVQIVAAGAVLGSAVAAPDGSYSVAPAAPLADGTYAVQAQAADGSGNTSAPSAPMTLTILATPPPAPAPPSLLAADDSGTPGDGITNVAQPHLVGSSNPGMTARLLTTSGVLLATSGVATDGTYTMTLAGPLADGTYSLVVRVTDVAGNSSPLSAPFSLTIVTQPPPAPAGPVLLPADDSGVKGDGLTNVTRPRVTGTSVPGATVQLVSAGAVLGSTVVAADGTYTVQPASALSDGSYSLQTRAVDVAGNTGPASPALTLTIQTTPPAAPGAPTLFPVDASGPAGSGRTSVRRPRLVGTTVPGTAVDLLDAGGNVLATAAAAPGSGSYLLQPSSNLGVGAVPLRVRLRDAVGNVSQPGPALTVTVVNAAPSDFEGDGKTDMAVWTPVSGRWALNRSSGGPNTFTFFGYSNFYDIPVPGDYDGLGHSELAVFRPSTAQWIIYGPGGPRTLSFGAPNLYDIPVPGDYDGVGYTEPAVFRPSTSQWFVLGPTGGHPVATFGAPNLYDIPVPGDYDGVGHTEPAVFRRSTAEWFVLGPGGGHPLGTFGAPNLFDIPVPGDYDGVGHTEMAVFRPSTGQWFVLGLNGMRLVGQFGMLNLFDIPVEASVASLRRLGIVGGPRMYSTTSGAAAPPRPAALSVSRPTDPTPASRASSTPPVPVAPFVAKKRPAQDVVSEAIERLLRGE